MPNDQAQAQALMAAVGKYAVTVKHAAVLLSISERHVRAALKEKKLIPMPTPGDTTIAIPHLLAWAHGDDEHAADAPVITKAEGDYAMKLKELIAN